MDNAADRLIARIRSVGNAVVVGIDPRPSQFPAEIRGRFPETRAGVAESMRAFSEAILDVVAGLVPAVKFQSAFFEEFGPEGVAALHQAAAGARRRGLFVIIDGKRNDIGSTAEAYARGYLGRPPVSEGEGPSWDADALTINPYLGGDGIAPFASVASERGKGLFVLVRTSNPSAGDFQDLVADGKPIYRHVADRLVEWAGPLRGESGYSALGAVVGATYPEQLAELRAAMPGILFLIPGYGAQGGRATDIAAGCDAQGLGAVVNCSRGIIFAFERPDLRARFGDDWRAAVSFAVREMVDDLAANTPMGRLQA
ncbi:orotidine-5'-phosphate decarboxylase [Tautonia plasticadhaerens]|uniref:Orotidine 5'-phosphate decarboxylase n=1 Tax=Tautonia plasticadhaerens TaxID=2527974 RepID=A0A518GZU6_9BACT|nr:orotidine-5'-phosphate decarboxylase [Tautonia plasticadhaerens]QDV34110.1 Orotidine 5'-phosphate decarboxylase [Tautonia plasticadhaerens]